MEDLYRSQFRLPWSLYEALKSEAETSGRSLNAEVIRRLETSFQTDKFLSLDVDGPAARAAVLEVMQLVRQLDVVDLLEAVGEIAEALPSTLIESNTDLKSSLRAVRLLTKRLGITPERAARIKHDYDVKFKGAVEHMIEAENRQGSEPQVQAILDMTDRLMAPKHAGASSPPETKTSSKRTVRKSRPKTL